MISAHISSVSMCKGLVAVLFKRLKVEDCVRILQLQNHVVAAILQIFVQKQKKGGKFDTRPTRANVNIYSHMLKRSCCLSKILQQLSWKINLLFRTTSKLPADALAKPRHKLNKIPRKTLYVGNIKFVLCLLTAASLPSFLISPGFLTYSVL